MGPSAGNPFLFRDSRDDLFEPLLLLLDRGDEEDDEDNDPPDFGNSSKSNDGSCFRTRQNSWMFL